MPTTRSLRRGLAIMWTPAKQPSQSYASTSILPGMMGTMSEGVKAEATPALAGMTTS
jgi:hypothetical protein